MDAKGNIEVWLQRLVDGMQDTVKQVIKRAVRNVYVSPCPSLDACVFVVGPLDLEQSGDSRAGQSFLGCGCSRHDS